MWVGTVKVLYCIRVIYNVHQQGYISCISQKECPWGTASKGSRPALIPQWTKEKGDRVSCASLAYTQSGLHWWFSLLIQLWAMTFPRDLSFDFQISNCESRTSLAISRAAPTVWGSCISFFSLRTVARFSCIPSIKYPRIRGLNANFNKMLIELVVDATFARYR